MRLVEDLLRGDKKAAGKLISLLEDGDPEAVSALSTIFKHTGKAHVVGMSGPPGTGKSTLIYGLAKEFRQRGRKVGIIGIDPSSPLTGGAFLGDRIRMRELTRDEGVFIRSMGTRGRPGGISLSTGDAVKILDALGCDIVFVETAGAGQSDVDISGLALTTVIVEMPSLGDEIQALKAGILEVGDIFVVNKSDLAGTSETVSSLEMMIDMAETKGWIPPVLETVATEGKGVRELTDDIERHLAYLKESGEMDKRRREQTRRELSEVLKEVLLDHLRERASSELLNSYVERILAKELDSRTAAKEIIREVGWSS